MFFLIPAIYENRVKSDEANAIQRIQNFKSYMNKKIDNKIDYLKKKQANEKEEKSKEKDTTAEESTTTTTAKKSLTTEIETITTEEKNAPSE